MNRRFILGLFCCGTFVLASAAQFLTSPGHAAAPVAKPNPNADRARREVRLLDDIYKTAIVLITKHYVDEKSDLPAGEAFKVLFQGMQEKGWHEVRLLDGLGQPLNEENKPRDAFERKAIEEVLAGKPGYEEIATKDGQQYLRSATTLPMVMEKCTLCHDNFKDKKIVGALSYTLPLGVQPSGE